jgi:two-component sensor histidine kinase
MLCEAFGRSRSSFTRSMSKEPKGLGSTLVQLMANQLHGSVEREEANPGCRVVLRLRREN